MIAIQFFPRKRLKEKITQLTEELEEANRREAEWKEHLDTCHKCQKTWRK